MNFNSMGLFSQDRRPPDPPRRQKAEGASLLIEKTGGDGGVSGARDGRDAECDLAVYDFEELLGALRAVGGIQGQSFYKHIAEKRRQVTDMNGRRDQSFAAQALDALPQWRE